jgi:hypothetical protein
LRGERLRLQEDHLLPASGQLRNHFRWLRRHDQLRAGLPRGCAILRRERLREGSLKVTSGRPPPDVWFDDLAIDDNRIGCQ